MKSKDQILLEEAYKRVYQNVREGLDYSIYKDPVKIKEFLKNTLINWGNNIYDHKFRYDVGEAIERLIVLKELNLGVKYNWNSRKVTSDEVYAYLRKEFLDTETDKNNKNAIKKAIDEDELQNEIGGEQYQEDWNKSKYEPSYLDSPPEPSKAPPKIIPKNKPPEVTPRRANNEREMLVALYHSRPDVQEEFGSLEKFLDAMTQTARRNKF
jgi:hypothetical protein